MQTEAQAAEVRKQLLEIKKALKIPYTSIDGDNDAPQNILKLLGEKYQLS
jgi:hypothetical protein